jgi:hypothetical protein
LFIHSPCIDEELIVDLMKFETGPDGGVIHALGYARTLRAEIYQHAKSRVKPHGVWDAAG